MLYSVIIVKLSVLFAFHQSECLWTTKLKFIFGKGGRRVSSHRLALLNITRSPSLSLSLSLSGFHFIGLKFLSPPFRSDLRR